MTEPTFRNAGGVVFNKKNGMISYPALLHPLPKEVQATLKMLGQHCIDTRDCEEYEDSYELLEKFEIRIRKEFGQKLERPEIKPLGRMLM